LRVARETTRSPPRAGALSNEQDLEQKVRAYRQTVRAHRGRACPEENVRVRVFFSCRDESRRCATELD
jgi:hypothetical protein